jgi:class 3 adenylate cyclase/TolB-like protein
MAHQVERRLTAILAADVVGYSRLMEADEEGTIAALKAILQDLIEPTIARHHGRIVKLMGDGVLADFPSVVEALRCAIAIQRDMHSRAADQAEGEAFVFRIGLNVGDTIIQDDAIFGSGVNVAARLESLADPGGILVSGTAYDQLAGKVDCGLEFAGEQQVKNITQPVRTYRVVLDQDQQAKIVPGKRVRPTRRFGRGLIAAGMAAAIGLLSGIAYWLWPVEAARARPAPVAVLPLDPLSSDPDQEYFADGLTKDIITELARNKELLVIARHTSFSFRCKGLKVEDIARELDAKYVLEGSVRVVGDDLRLNVQLIQGSTGEYAGAERYDRPTRQIVDVQDDIVQQVSSQILTEIRRSEKALADRRPINDFDAYALTLKSVSLKHKFMPEGYQTARRYLERAIELDPKLALAHATLGFVNAIDITMSITEEAATIDLDREIRRLQKAIAMEPAMSMAYQALALAYTIKGDLDNAVRAAERSISRAPNDPEGYLQLAFVQGSLGQFEESIASMQTAFLLNPKYPVWYQEVLSRSYFGLERYDEAIGAAADGLQVQADYVLCQMWLSASQMGAGQKEAAMATAKQLLVDTPGFTLETASFSGFLKRPDRTKAMMRYLRDAGIPEAPKVAGTR